LATCMVVLSPTRGDDFRPRQLALLDATSGPDVGDPYHLAITPSCSRPPPLPGRCVSASR
jgi:hypothetical protein